MPSTKDSIARNRSATTFDDGQSLPGNVNSERQPLTGEPVQVYRSLKRPPMGLLTAFDDGSTETGEQWRIRSSHFVIGRTSGDCLISHDGDISARHAEVGFVTSKAGFRWYIRDLKSTNGTFVQVRRCILRSGQRIQIGGRRYVFEEAHTPTYPSADAPLTTLHQDEDSFTARSCEPRLVRYSHVHGPRVFPLSGTCIRIGTAISSTELTIEDDPFVSPQHATLRRHSDGRWVLTDNGSVNGVWKQINGTSVDSKKMFLVGGQRFEFRVL